MSDDTSREKGYSQLKAIGVFVLIFFTLLGIDSDTQRRWIEEEVNAFANFVDRDSLDSVLVRTNKWFYYINETKGMKMWLYETFIPKEDSENPAVKKTNKFGSVYLHRFADNVTNNVYLMMYRVSQFWFWLALLWPLGLAIVYDGYNLWVTKRYSFGHVDTTTYTISKHSMFIIASLSVFYIFTPIPMASVAVLLPMGIILLLSWTAKRTVKGFKKIL